MTILALCWGECSLAGNVSKYDAGGVPDIHPKGWLLTLMQRQHDGLTGHPEALSYPYNSCLWAGEISRPDESYGDNWWRYEQTAYYTDGLLRLGYELNAGEMVDKAMEGIEYTLANATDAGVLGNSSLVGITWPMSVFFRVLQAKYEHDGDPRIPKALERHYLNFTEEDLAGGIVGGRNIMSLEGILWTYGKTGNEKLLKLAAEYPFGEVLTFSVSGQEGASIPLTLRIPTWCHNATASINGATAGVELQAGTFARLPEKVKNGDVITLTLPMTVEKKNIEGQGIYFQRGPLLFAYAIPQKMEEDTEVYENMHGKEPENPDFKCWNITPTGDFNYAYDDDGHPVAVNYPAIEEINGTIPFDLLYTTVKLRVPVKQIKWDLVDNRYTPHLPEQGHLTLLDNERTYIELVPYGCTELRLTVFPDTKAQPSEQPVPDYTRPADAPECVQVEDDRYCAYFELPRFCWDEPVWCKVRKAGDDVNLHSNKDGDLCVMVGTTANGRKIWKWTGPAVTEEAPKEIIFTNHDLLTPIMSFANGGYYHYDRLMYKAGQTSPTGVKRLKADDDDAVGYYYDLQGRRYSRKPTSKGVIINRGKKVVSIGSY